MIVLFAIIAIAVIIYILMKEFDWQPKKKETQAPKSEWKLVKVEEARKYPYAEKMLLTRTEYGFYKILKEVCDQNKMLICPKVRMEDFLEVTDKQNYMKYRGYIKSRHIDFMLCDSSLRIIAGLELDDNTHKKSSAQETDDFKNNVFKTVGIPLYRVKTYSGTYKEQLEKIMAELNPGSAGGATESGAGETK